MLRILLADDHAILRQGLKQILSEEFSDILCGETGTTAETIAALRREPWDALILDIGMPDRSGLDVLQAASRDYPRLPILVLSSSPEDQMALRVLKAGARGYLNKQSAAEELIGAMKKILSGGRYVSHALAETLAVEVREERQTSDRPPHERLSNREYQVFGLLVEGRSIKEIAEKMSLSAKTVSTYRVRLCEKLGVKNVVELAHYAHQHRLFT